MKIFLSCLLITCLVANIFATESEPYIRPIIDDKPQPNELISDIVSDARNGLRDGLQTANDALRLVKDELNHALDRAGHLSWNTRSLVVGVADKISSLVNHGTDQVRSTIESSIRQVTDTVNHVIKSKWAEIDALEQCARDKYITTPTTMPTLDLTSCFWNASPLKAAIDNFKRASNNLAATQKEAVPQVVKCLNDMITHMNEHGMGRLCFTNIHLSKGSELSNSVSRFVSAGLEMGSAMTSTSKTIVECVEKKADVIIREWGHLGVSIENCPRLRIVIQRANEEAKKLRAKYAAAPMLNKSA